MDVRIYVVIIFLLLIKMSNLTQQYADIYLPAKSLWPEQTTLEGSSFTSIMTYTRGSGYSF